MNTALACTTAIIFIRVTVLFMSWKPKAIALLPKLRRKQHTTDGCGVATGHSVSSDKEIQSCFSSSVTLWAVKLTVTRITVTEKQRILVQHTDSAG